MRLNSVREYTSHRCGAIVVPDDVRKVIEAISRIPETKNCRENKGSPQVSHVWAARSVCYTHKKQKITRTSCLDALSIHLKNLCMMIRNKLSVFESGSGSNPGGEKSSNRSSIGALNGRGLVSAWNKVRKVPVEYLVRWCCP